MNPEEFARQLNELQREIFRAIVSYHVRLALWETPEVVDILNRYRGFFIPVRDALYGNMVMGFAKVFDRDGRTMSLKNLLKVAEKDVDKLVPNMTREKIEELEQHLSRHDAVLETIKQLRDQHFAHLDAIPQPKLPLIKKDMDQVIKTLKNVFNQLSAGHDKSVYSWYQANRSAWETSEILRILSEDAEARKAEADALMRAVENDEA
ncbi:MAG: hypothetical protein HY665_02615 [Chloroflexi bacterium]|nr:hypothetical protein [Chloroflexota bacterium]